jgi:hypothetical protein
MTPKQRLAKSTALKLVVEGSPEPISLSRSFESGQDSLHWKFTPMMFVDLRLLGQFLM